MSIKRGYLLADKENLHYGFKVKKVINDSFCKLFFSKIGGWASHVSGKLAATLKDDGNGVDITIDGKPIRRLNYGELAELVVLLNTYRHYDPLLMQEYQLLESVKAKGLKRAI